MERKTKERWMELCEQAAVEQNPVKLFQLSQEIIRLLKEKEERLYKPRSAKDKWNANRGAEAPRNNNGN